MNTSIFIRDHGLCDYLSTWDEMKQFTAQRTADTPDELWLLEHFPVFTQGQAGKAEHILNAGSIPIIQSDRGGQVTYHGPGQLIVYVLLDLRRRHLSVRDLVCHLERSVIALLKAQWDIEAYARREAPGVYVNSAKIASLGLRVRHGCTLHGLSFNINMDMEPFSRINPCGHQGLQVTQLVDLIGACDVSEVKPMLLNYLVDCFNQDSSI